MAEGGIEVLVAGRDFLLHVILEDVVEYTRFQLLTPTAQHEPKADELDHAELFWLLFILEFRLVEETVEDGCIVLQALPRLVLLERVFQLPQRHCVFVLDIDVALDPSLVLVDAHAVEGEGELELLHLVQPSQQS